MRLDLQWVPRVLAGFCITFSESLDPPWSDFSEFSADFFVFFSQVLVPILGPKKGPKKGPRIRALIGFLIRRPTRGPFWGPKMDPKMSTRICTCFGFLCVFCPML